MNLSTLLLSSLVAPLLIAPDSALAQTRVGKQQDTATTTTPAAPQAIQPSSSVVYKTSTDARGQKVELKLHFFEPAGHQPAAKIPAILFFFGGGWQNGSPTAFFPHCVYFASRGMVAVAADYRVHTRQGTTPFECVADGKSAVRYLRANAEKLGIDPQRISAAGSSAGGHVAASAGIISTLDEESEDAAISSMPNALVLYNPVIDTSPEGYGHARLGERWREISPQHHVRAGLPSTIVFHGTADKTVPYSNAQAFEKTMKQAGNRCELVSLAAVGHGFIYNLANKTARQATRDTDLFLASLGYLKGEPTLAVPR